MKHKIYLIILLIVIALIFFFWPGHPPYDFLMKTLGIESLSQGTQGQSSERDDFGCFYSCSFFPEGSKQMCEDWKAGKGVQWPSDCKMMQYGPCIQLCEVEKKAGRGGSPQQEFPTTKDEFNYPETNEQRDIGDFIPKEDPGAEDVYIYVTDFRHGRLIRMDDMTGKGWVSFGAVGGGVGKFNEINQVVTDKQGRIYITDEENYRLVRIDDMTGKNWVEYHVQGPFGMDLDSKDRIYFVEQGYNHVVRIDNMNGDGKVVFGTLGSGVNQFNGIKYLELDFLDRIYVGDKCNYRVIRFDDMLGSNWIAFQSNGTIKEAEACDGNALGISGNGAGQLKREVGGIAIDSQDRIYVADEHNNRIIRMDDMTGKGWVEFKGVDDDKLGFPHDIAISKSGKIYIADTFNNRIVRIDDMTGKGWIAFAPPFAKDQGLGYHEWGMEAPKGIFVVER